MRPFFRLARMVVRGLIQNLIPSHAPARACSSKGGWFSFRPQPVNVARMRGVWVRATSYFGFASRQQRSPHPAALCPRRRGRIRYAGV